MFSVIILQPWNEEHSTSAPALSCSRIARDEPSLRAGRISANADTESRTWNSSFLFLAFSTQLSNSSHGIWHLGPGRDAEPAIGSGMWMLRSRTQRSTKLSIVAVTLSVVRSSRAPGRAWRTGMTVERLTGVGRSPCIPIKTCFEVIDFNWRWKNVSSAHLPFSNQIRLELFFWHI